MYRFKVRETDEVGEPIVGGWSCIQECDASSEDDACMMLMGHFLSFMEDSSKNAFFIALPQKEGDDKKIPFTTYDIRTFQNVFVGTGTTIHFGKFLLSEILQDESFRIETIKVDLRRIVFDTAAGRVRQEFFGNLIYGKDSGLTEIPIGLPYGEVPDFIPTGNQTAVTFILRDQGVPAVAYKVDFSLNDRFETVKTVTVWLR